MSTLKVSTLQDLSAANSSTPEQISQGRAKAWVRFNGTGTPAINDSYNVTSITDNGTGDYTVNFTTALSNANYAAALGCRDRSSASNANGICSEYNLASASTKTTTAFRITTNCSAAGVYDADGVSVVIFGD